MLIVPLLASSQNKKEKKYYLNGYISQMNQTRIDSIDGDWVTDGLIHNRLMFNYYGIKNLTFDFEVRNRLMYGETFKMIPNYADNFDVDKGFFDLTHNWVNGNSYVLNSSIDRFYLQYEIGKFKATVGRQRINWGMTFVWNPNDLFNNYSFFDFDYGEKPGADAIYLQYFRNYASSIEVAAKINSDTNITAAMKYGFNLFNYDFQFVGGILDGEELAIGTGWTGNIWNLTFRGEGTYLHPTDNFGDTSGVFIGSLGFDYMFANSLTITAEYLFNDAANLQNFNGNFQLMEAPENIKGLSIAKHSAVLQVSYPISPIINTSLAGMWMNEFDILFFSPNISFALSQDVDFSLVGQFVTAKIPNPITMKDQRLAISYLFFRLKYSF